VFIPVARGPGGRADIRIAMMALAERGITRVLIEGGPALAASVLAADLADEALLFRAAAASQSETIRPFGAACLAALTAHDHLRLHAQRMIGPDRLSIYRRAEFW
jgi:diaminohydroxyphosphoribosylaminopyrimidine deaminase/5-amino-6-(5-phosphoribosylamino)uracil reductase